MIAVGVIRGYLQACGGHAAGRAARKNPQNGGVECWARATSEISILQSVTLSRKMPKFRFPKSTRQLTLNGMALLRLYGEEQRTTVETPSYNKLPFFRITFF